ncbi:MAG: DUF448 domain-containing protein [Desulfuromonadaceae bacterium]|nr:DUF448 domain-containing protein [Desulfuromonas sp.]MDY0184575.1 DUF448 domain-containing protein [Desulfuromonadaceae bacterium]
MTERIRVPERSCIACRKKLPMEDLLRFVCSPDAELLVDYRHKLPGRGAYTCCSTACFERALEINAFARALKCSELKSSCNAAPVHVILQQLQTQILAKVISLLGMARKSGVAVSGQQAIVIALRRSGNVAWVLMADDMSASGADKLLRQLETRKVRVLRGLDKEVLTQALGGGERSAVLLWKGSLAQALERELQRYIDVMGES